MIQLKWVKERLQRIWLALPPRRRNQVGWAAGLVLFYTLFGFLVFPWIIKLVAVNQLSKEFDRETTIRQVRINPYVLSGTVRGLLVKDKDGQPFLSLEEAYANFQLSSFFGRHWVFKDIWVIKPYLRVQINPDYSFNFSDLIKKYSQPPPASKAPNKPLYLDVGKFQIIGAGASFTDLTLRTPFRRQIGPVQIVLTGLHTDPNSENPYSFVGTTDSGEKFSWSGRFSLEPLQSSGELALQGLSLPKYAPLFQDMVRFELKDGVLDGRAVYRCALTESNYVAAVTNASGSLTGLRVTERGGTDDVIELDRFAVSGVSADTSARTAEVGEVAVEGCRVSAKRNQDQSINLLELSEPSADARAPGGILFLLQAATNALAALVESTNLWSATVHHVEVTNCVVQWEDQAMARPVRLRVDDIALSARQLSNIAGSNQTSELSLRWNTNGTVRVAARVQLSPPEADIRMSVTNLELHPLDPYLQPFVNAFLIDSKVGVEGILQMRTGTNQLPEVTFHGDAKLDDFATVDEESEELLKWNSVQVTGLEAGLQPPSVSVKEIAVVEPSVRIALDTNQTLNFLTVLKTPATNAADAAATAAAATTEPKTAGKKLSLGRKVGGMLREALSWSTNAAGGTGMPKISVATISITNGLVEFDDHSVQPPASSSLQELNGVITGITSEELKQAELHFTAKAARTGPIEISGRINPLNRNAPTQLTMIFHDVDLTPASPYSGKFLGYRLNRGRLGLQADYQITERHVKAKNVVVLDQFTLGEKVPSPDATKLPVKLGIALLKDRNGRIELELPVDGSLDDPNFHFGKVVFHVLESVMTKIVTSPFAALGALFGGKGEEVSFQDFAPGSAQLQAENVQKVDKLVNGLYERPGLELQIEGCFDPVADGDGLRKRKLLVRFREQKWAVLRKSEQAEMTPDQVSLPPEEYAALLESAYNAAVRSGQTAGTNEMTHTTLPARGTATQKAEMAAITSEQKGATALMQRPAPEPTVAVDDKEQLVLSTIPVSDNELLQLASDRARNVRQRILDTGKVDEARLFLVDTGTNGSTNHATRVYFHLQ